MIELQQRPDGTIGAVRWVPSIRASKSSAVYSSEANLPDDLQVAMAALKLVNPPEEIAGVGQRVSEHLFWIYNCDELVSTTSFLENDMKNIKTNYNHHDYYIHRTDPRPDIPFEDNSGLYNPERKWYFWAVMAVAATVVLSYIVGFISVA